MALSPSRRRRAVAGLSLLAGAALTLTLLPSAQASVAEPDPREGLGAGLYDAETVTEGIDLLSTQPKPDGVNGTNSDLAFSGDYVYSGNYNGVNIYDVSDPAAPVLATSVFCPGNQNDISVYGDLLILSVEATSGRVGCASAAELPGGSANPQNVFRGIRVFDISDRTNPVNIAEVQTCKGSHTHTIVGEKDGDLYVYGSGTAGVRSTAELGRCSGASSLLDPDTANFAIDVIRIPLDDPASAEWVDNARIFSTCGSSACEADHASGALNSFPLSNPQPLVAEGLQAPGGQSASQVVTCHDLTSYPAKGLTAGACQGAGLLLDTSDPENPVRVDAVVDPNFAYWHSATFNNAGDKVIFTDEWGGGGAARCTPTSNVSILGGVVDTPTNWGANAIFDIEGTDEAPDMALKSYYKIPNVQSAAENCVAHNGSLVPVPGRDIMVQAWYQGGTSVFDFTDSANPVEIAFIDRGPVDASRLVSGGYWSSYWYNGAVFGNEIARGFDSMALTETDALNAVELAAAASVVEDETNVQNQQEIVWPASFTTVRAWQSAVERQGLLDDELSDKITATVDRAERFSTGPQAAKAKANSIRDLRRLGGLVGDSDVEAGLADAIEELADTL
ncbi:LVIVD repeat-containing protein [Aquipuribacter sp. SD81]|uniref:LVIVD repeat-containing protein n=1 Tax=Aquipuribacter sp. SD81 TaxID=3127703 RepID=UPI00301850BA